MIAIVCLDENNGMFFNGKQFKLSEYRIILAKESDEIIKYLSSPLFKGIGQKLAKQIVDILKAKKVFLYRWDKVYPADYKLPLRQYKLVSTLEFQGYSHDKIVKEVYERNETIKK